MLDILKWEFSAQCERQSAKSSDKERIRMKRVYKTPKAVLVDFCYDEQVVAASSGVAMHGDPQQIGKCQQSDESTCKYFWLDILGGICKAEPHSFPGFPVA